MGGKRHTQHYSINKSTTSVATGFINHWAPQVSVRWWPDPEYSCSVIINKCTPAVSRTSWSLVLWCIQCNIRLLAICCKSILWTDSGGSGPRVKIMTGGGWMERWKEGINGVSINMNYRGEKLLFYDYWTVIDQVGWWVQCLCRTLLTSWHAVQCGGYF